MIPIARPQTPIDMKAMMPGIWDGLKKTFHFWMETETHVYAFSVAANVLLSFYPFLYVILALTRRLLGTQAAVAAIELALQDFFRGVWKSCCNRAWSVPPRGTSNCFPSSCCCSPRMACSSPWRSR